MVTKRVLLKTQDELARLLGPHDENIKELERRLGVQIFLRSAQPGDLGQVTIAIRGKTRPVDRAVEEIKEKIAQILSGAETNESKKMIGSVNHLERVSGLESTKENGQIIFTTSSGKAIRHRTPAQREYIEVVQQNDLVFCIGPAGTGKTFLVCAMALAALRTGKVNRIVLTRPVVEAGERLGFLPGDLYEKVNPYLKPLYDAFYAMVGSDRFRTLRDEEVIEIVPLAYMRGRTLDNAFVILDEAQNSTPDQMKMFLTRLGAGSQAVVTGDVTQIDLENKRLSGLVQIEKILGGIPGICFIHLTQKDVVRHEIVRKIIQAYEEWEERKKDS